MFDTVLIANRGEIACRVIRTARDMGLRAVAVYSDADTDARHVQMADQAVHIGGPAPADSYLRGDRIIAAAQATGAQAIHPGYGFLSENPDFVEAVTAAGLTFVGPSAQAIRAMGLKDAAKALMEQAGVPVVPGYHGADQSDAHLAQAAQEVGYPVLIKAVAGGGGKGMRLVDSPAGFVDALASARAEAQTAFGNPDVLIEKFIQNPRHIEVQVFGDGQDALHLFERDCSLQRRHQKVIEEAPAPGMTAPVRDAMGAAAVRAARAIGYCGAGTVEFIADGSGALRPDGFWFMEMNTRLQVEHPVTELVTGVDLVAWQLRVAMGEALPMAQADLSLTGHAFEARLYAEDVPAGFLPATGRLAHLAFPKDARADTGVRSGDSISPHYDPMIAKVIVQGADRAEALRRLSRALDQTQVAGTVTNLSFLQALSRHKGFGAGQVDTGLIGRDLEDLVAVSPPDGATRAQMAWAAAGLMAAPDWDRGFALWGPLWRDVVLDLGEGAVTLRVQCAGASGVVDLGDTQVAVRWRDSPAGGAWIFDGQVAADWVRHGGVGGAGGDQITVFARHTVTARCVDPLDRGSDDAARGVVEAPMPGLLRAVLVAPGQEVSKGDRLAILEAMKMEHTLTAPRDGIIAEVLGTAGTQVEAGVALVRLKDEDTEGQGAKDTQA